MPMKMSYTLPEYLPDQNAIAAGLDVARNVIPRADGYGPLGSFSGFSAPIGAAFKGGSAFLDTSGSSVLLVGTETGLLRYTSTGWDSLVSGMSGIEAWRFGQFGDVAIGVNGVSTKVVDFVTNTATDLTDAPAGTSIAIVGDYVVIGQASGDKLGVYTSGFNDHTDWDYTSATSTATYQPMLDGGEVMGLAGGEYGVILQRQAIRRMTRTGDATAPFQYDLVSNNIGCASKASVVAVGRTVYWLSERGFMSLSDGQGTPTPIGSQRVDETFQASIGRDDYERIFSCADPRRKLIMWCIPGSPGVVWIYHYELDRWSTARLVIDGMFPAFTASTSLDDLDALYATIEDVPVSLDDARWQGGAPLLYVVAGGVMGTLSGSNLAASFETGMLSPAAPNVTRLIAMRPISDAIDGITMDVDCRLRLGDVESITSAGALRRSGTIPVRASGRYIRFGVDIAAGAPWSFIQGFEVEYEAGGGR